jgi:hypothetical protein
MLRRSMRGEGESCAEDVSKNHFTEGESCGGGLYLGSWWEKKNGATKD